jgi:predicted PurR-regulated permease PerM
VIEHKVRPARAIMQRLNDIAVRASSLGTPATETRTPQASVPTAAVTAGDVIAETGRVAAGLVTVAALTLLLLSVGPPALARMTAALGGNVPAVHVLRTIAAIRLEMARYYGILALINLSLGVATTIAMWLLHMPTPMLWGAMAAVLNFIPYLGSAITLVTVTIVALVTFDSTPHILLVGAAYLGLATIEGQLIEPFFFGRRLQLNPVVVFVALWLGGWLWGIAGIFLALPVLVATKVAASQPGGNDVVLRFLGPAAHKLPDEPTSKGGEHDVEVPTLRTRESR